MTQLLNGKTAIVYGAGGDLGSAVARTFASEGATVHLAGHTREPLERLAAEIGPQAKPAVLDALDERAVDEHAAAVTTERFLHAITAGTTTAFVTARAAARHMVPKGSGVILHLTSGSSRGAAPGMGNTGPTDAAVEAFHRYLAAGLGPHGVRVAGIHTAAVKGTLTREKIARVSGAAVDPEMAYAGVASMAMLRRVPELEQVADTAAFLASDRAGAITSGIVNATCGLVAG